MNFRIILFFLVFAIVHQTGAAQTLHGTVTDASSGNPLPAASVMLGKKAVSTDSEGKFLLKCSAGELQVTFIGYSTYQQMINDCNAPLKINLQRTNFNMSEVEITATSNTNKSLIYQPVSITKLSTTEIKRGLGLYFDDAINANVPGVFFQRRGVSSGQQFNIRGYGGGSGGTGRISSNFDGQGVKVYYNGIPLTDAEGITLLDDIDFNSVGDVEVSKGPSGTLYGLAIAGVVNLKTIKPAQGKVSVGQDVLMGSYGLRRLTTHLAVSGKNSSLLVTYGNQKTDGYFNHNASKKDFVNIVGEFTPNEKQKISTYFGYSNSYDERAGELTLAQWAAKDYSGNADYIIRNAHSETISFRAGFSHTYNFNNNIANTTTVFGTGLTNNVSSAGGWTDKDPVNYGLRSTFDTKFLLTKNISLSGITGVETQHQYAQTIGYTMVKNPVDTSGYYIIGTQRSNQYTKTGTTSVFTEWTLALPHGVFLTSGMGLSEMNIELNDRFYVAGSTKPNKYSKSYRGLVSPHFALNKVVSKSVSFYASYSQAYKAPTSAYFFIPATGALNTDLKPETGRQFEVGSKGSILNNKLTYQFALFNARFRDKFSANNVLNPAGTATIYTYVSNSGNLNNKGLEFQTKIAAYKSSAGFIRSIDPFANLTFSNFKYDGYVFHTKNKAGLDSAINYDGKAVAGVPRFAMNAGIDLLFGEGFYANALYMHKGGFPITSDGLNNTIAYNLLNAKIGIQRSLNSHFDLNVYFGADNLTGTRYPIFVFINQLPDAYLPAPINTNFYGGINIRYNIK